MGLEFNATLIAQIVDVLILLLIITGIFSLIYKVLSFKRNINSKIETMDKELKEIKKILRERND